MLLLFIFLLQWQYIIVKLNAKKKKSQKMFGLFCLGGVSTPEHCLQFFFTFKITL